jgi:hypothetical protein
VTLIWDGKENEGIMSYYAHYELQNLLFYFIPWDLHTPKNKNDNLCALNLILSLFTLYFYQFNRYFHGVVLLKNSWLYGSFYKL